MIHVAAENSTPGSSFSLDSQAVLSAIANRQRSSLLIGGRT